MALEGASIGDAFIDIHANTSPFDHELRPSLKKASEDADEVINKIGEEWGRKLSASASNEISKHGKDFGRSLEKATESIKVKVKGKWDIDNNVVRDARGRFVARMEREVEEAIVSVGRPGGPFNRFGQAIADAIGAGFNISGKSPLIAVLAPLIGAIIGLVAAALQALNAFAAVLATLPVLLVTLGAQAAIVMVAFQGMGQAIQGALAAKNAKELNEAIKDLTPSARNFVREIVQAKDAFKAIQRSIQEQFFAGLGNIVGPLIKIFDPITMSRVSALARDLGEFFRGIALFFASDTFRKFLNEVLPATGKFLDRFGPAFVTFLTGLIKFSEAALPFLNILGGIASNIFENWGKSLSKAAKDPATKKWFSDMEDTLQAVRDLFGTVIDFVIVFLAKLNEAGGVKIIEQLTASFEQLIFLLGSPVGEEFMRGLINFSILAIQITTGLIDALIILVATVDFVFRAIGAFFSWLGGLIGDLFTWIGQKILDFFHWLQKIVGDVAHEISKIWTTAKNSVVGAFQDAINFFTSIPDKIVAVFKNASNLLFGAGRNVIGGLISGIKSAIPDMVKALETAAAEIPKHKGPEDKDRKLLVPAGHAVMQGFTTGLREGATDVKAMLTDFTASLGGMALHTANSPITFGRDSIRISFEGALPTTEQAQSTGTAVGAGITGALARRNTRLAVRTL